MTQTATIAAPTPLGTDVAAGPLTLRLEEAVVADGNSTVAGTNQQNAEPPEGLAYVLAKITVANTGGQRASVTVSDFPATGTDGVLRRCPSIALPADPLNATIDPGASVTGWTGALVNDVSSVVMFFDPAIVQGERYAASFALTDGATLPTFDPVGDPTDAGAKLESPAAVGEPIRTAVWEVTVNDAIDSDAFYEISDYRVRALGAPDPNDPMSWQAVGLDLTVRNVAATPQFFSWTALELIDTDGEPWDHLLAMTQPLPPASVELLPGASARGWYGIWLWPWATTGLLRFRDSKLSDDFRYISLDGTTGATQQATSQTAQPAATAQATAEPLNLGLGDVAKVGSDPLNLRLEPSVDGDIVAELKPGTQLAIIGAPVEAESYTWYPVEVVDTGKTGYVAEGFLVPAGD
jgi:hypothetical protein